MIITVGGIKGGIGKSTIAMNLAIWLGKRLPEGEEVLVIDADDQETSGDFHIMRCDVFENVGYTYAKGTGSSLWKDLQKFGTRYNYVIVDTAGLDSSSLRSALIATDMFLIPFTPKAPALWTITRVKKLLSEVNNVRVDVLKGTAFINCAITHPQDKRNGLVADVLRQTNELTFIEPMIYDRISISDSFGFGVGIEEWDNPIDPKAISEVNTLFSEIIQLGK